MNIMTDRDVNVQYTDVESENLLTASFQSVLVLVTFNGICKLTDFHPVVDLSSLKM
jgi:hypothetical protein